MYFLFFHSALSHISGSHKLLPCSKDQLLWSISTNIARWCVIVCINLSTIPSAWGCKGSSSSSSLSAQWHGEILPHRSFSLPHQNGSHMVLYIGLSSWKLVYFTLSTVNNYTTHTFFELQTPIEVAFHHQDTIMSCSMCFSCWLSTVTSLLCTQPCSDHFLEYLVRKQPDSISLIWKS